jgi:uncharacterized glyoxalase superfamily protein PhnB
LDLGFTLVWELSSRSVLFTFLLQNFLVPQHSANFKMSLMVEGRDAWWEHIDRIGLNEKYSPTMLKPPEMQPWGIRVLYLSDPTGVLWHLADRKEA